MKLQNEAEQTLRNQPVHIVTFFYMRDTIND